METWEDLKNATPATPAIPEYGLQEIVDGLKPFVKDIVLSRTEDGDIVIEDANGDLKLRISLSPEDTYGVDLYRIYESYNNHKFVSLNYAVGAIKLALGKYNGLDRLYDVLLTD